MKSSLRSLILSGFVLVSLAACGNIRDDLGLGRSTPDEFAVVDRAPLSVPPDFSLRPPQPGAPRPQEPDMTQHAQNVLFSSNDEDKNQVAAVKKAKSSGESGIEKSLLTKAAADQADPNIRDVIDHESAEKAVGSPHLVDDLLWWKNDPAKQGTVVDAAAEAQRIKDAKAKNEPLNQGATPIIEKEKSGWLGL